MFLKDTFEWLGMTPDFVQIGDYKGASESYARSEPSKEWSENLEGLLDSLYGTIRSHMREGRGLSESELDAAMLKGWFTDADTAVELGLVDAAVDFPDLLEYFEEDMGTNVEWGTQVDKSKSMELGSDPFALFRMIMGGAPDHTPKRETIAILHIDGPIVDGDSSPGGLFAGGASTGSRTIRRALSEIAAEDKIKGVVVRIASPGGSAIASEVIWQGLRDVAKEKPVWVSISSMAASGGYYIAVGGEKIFVNPSSIVGSIGVVGGKIAMGGAFEKLKLNVVPHTRGPRAGMFSALSPWTTEERAAIRDEMQKTYDLFTSRVEAGRPGIDLSKTAEGRLFTGHDAVSLKMADEVGSLDDAITTLADSLNLRRYDVMDYPAPKSLDEILQEAFGMASVENLGASLVRAEIEAVLRELVGPSAWPSVRDSLSAMFLIRSEPVILTSPNVLIFK